MISRVDYREPYREPFTPKKLGDPKKFVILSEAKDPCI